MSRLRRVLDRARPAFAEGRRLHFLRPLYDTIDSFVFQTGRRTERAPHVRDALDLRRVMVIVLLALLPCSAMALWNTGYQANLALAQAGLARLPGWRGALLAPLGHDPGSFWANVGHGAAWFLPARLVALFVGVFWEILFAAVRRRRMVPGLPVLALLFTLTLPPALPLWQVALGISFGVVVAKELFGGTGRNFVNPVLAGRAFLYFAYPVEHSGDTVWTALDGFTHATPLTTVPLKGMQAIDVTWGEAFLGTMPGSLGETSTLACLIGAAALIATGIGSWRIMLGMLLGGAATAGVFVLIGSATNPMFAMGPAWHVVLGGFAFGLVFLATDPASAAQTDAGRWIYGVGCGVFTILLRVLSPAYPEGVMMAILLGNVFAPLIDWFVVEANVRRRRKRHG